MRYWIESSQNFEEVCKIWQLQFQMRQKLVKYEYLKLKSNQIWILKVFKVLNIHNIELEFRKFIKYKYLTNHLNLN